MDSSSCQPFLTKVPLQHTGIYAPAQVQGVKRGVYKLLGSPSTTFTLCTKVVLGSEMRKFWFSHFPRSTSLIKKSVKKKWSVKKP